MSCIEIQNETLHGQKGTFNTWPLFILLLVANQKLLISGSLCGSPSTAVLLVEERHEVSTLDTR